MARIYVSSTYSDLHEYRETVHRSLRQLGHDVVAMEDYVASDQRPLQRCLDDVAASDIYVGIIAWRYGHVPKDGNPAGLSITELEYRHAGATGVPRLMFLLDEEQPWPPVAVDSPGEEIRRLRAELSDEHLVSRFGSEDELARLAITAVAQLDNPGRLAITAEPVALTLCFAHEDLRLVDLLQSRALSPLVRRGLISEVSRVVLDQEQPSYRLPASLMSADVVVLVVSPHLSSSGFLERKEFSALLARSSAGQPQTVPVLLRRMSWNRLPAGLARLTPLPGLDRPVNEETNRDAAFVAISDGVELVCREVVARRRRAPRSAVQTRTHHRLIDVFKESGVPTVTFVEPDDFYDLKLALAQPGRGVVIEGPSGVGKTTALQTAIEQLDDQAGPAFEILRARNLDDVARIANLRAWHRSAVAIDDFHRLDERTRVDLVNYLKELADIEPVDRKLIIIGISGTGHRLVDIAYDIATRITVLPLGSVSDRKVVEMIEKGESALNIDLVYKAEIVRASAGSLNMAQVLCRHAAAIAGIRETQLVVTTVATDVQRTANKAIALIRPKFDNMIREFAALDGPEERICVDLLDELGTAENGVLSLRDLRTRRHDLRAGITRLLDEHLMQRMLERNPHFDRHLLFDAQAATLVVDDPQLTFYLRQLNPQKLLAEVGKVPATNRTRVFVSYSHHDAKWLDRLLVHLSPLERQGAVDVWADTRIAAGSLWRDEIESALDTARVAVLLISADFLASDFIRDGELPPLLEAADRGGCHILPLVIAPSLLADIPELSRYQTVNSPAKPLNAMSAHERESTLVTLAQTIATLTGRH